MFLIYVAIQNVFLVGISRNNIHQYISELLNHYQKIPKKKKKKITAKKEKEASCQKINELLNKKQ